MLMGPVLPIGGRDKPAGAADRWLGRPGAAGAETTGLVPWPGSFAWLRSTTGGGRVDRILV